LIRHHVIEQDLAACVVLVRLGPGPAKPTAEVIEHEINVSVVVGRHDRR
jgi:hypothetical protein